MPSRLTHRQSALTLVSCSLIALGVVLRLVQFAVRRSLWGDEAKLVLNIVDRSYLELFQVLDYDQVAPVGFLLVEKAVTQVLGSGEMALRLFPLLAGIAALALTYWLARRLLSPVAVPIALAFVALSDRLIYYSAEVKPYALDVAMTLAVLVCATITPKTITKAQASRAAVVGAIAIWLSYPVVLALAGVGVLWAGLALVGQPRGKPVRWGLLLLAVVPWAISFAVFYATSVHGSADNSTLLESWASRRGFPASVPDLDWLFYALKRMFQKPLSFPQPMLNHLAMAVWLMGSVVFFRRRPAAFGLLMSPLVMSIVAAYWYKYPFYSRLIVFLVPPMMMVMAEGIAMLLRRRWPVALGGVALAACLLYLPATASAKLVTNPTITEDIRPLLGHMQENWQPGDVLYVFQKSKFQFQFYSSQQGYQFDKVVAGVDADDLGIDEDDMPRLRRLYRDDLRPLCGTSRLWVLVADIDLREDTDAMQQQLNRLGQRTDRVEAGGLASFVERYDLSACRRTAANQQQGQEP